jgi:membrane-associated phospholipid phosphatase
MKHLLLSLLLFILFSGAYAQKVKKPHEKVYKMNYWVDVPVTIGLLGTYYFGYQAIQNRANPTTDQINALSKSNVWFFDRPALYLDASKMDNARNISDWGLKIATVMPVLLLIDRKIRRDWYDIALLYAETQTVALNAYMFGGPFFIERYRPFAYYDELTMEEKTGDGTVNSWFSGHTATTSTASFFMAKVYTDYHPELGGKKWIFYGAALIPPAIVGIYRIKALKHFPTDVIMGTAVGAAVGILIPHFHKIIKNKDLSFVPFAGEYTGLAMSLKF